MTCSGPTVLPTLAPPMPHRLSRTTSALLQIALLTSFGVAQTFQDRTTTSGLTNVGYSTAPFGCGIATADIDLDTDLDIVCVAAGGGSLHLYRNLGGLNFRDDTATANLAVSASQIHALVFGDIDNDGDPDLYVCSWRATPALFVNDGQGNFSEQAALRGLAGSITSKWSANFVDFDRDGWLDLFVGNRQDPATGTGQANILYRNTGGGNFVDVTRTAGVAGNGMTLASAFLDYDDDGWPDLIESNDKGNRGFPNELYRNLGNGTFATMGAALSANSAIDGMGVDFADVFCDGGTDIACSDSAPDHLLLCWSATTNRYVDRSIHAGLFTATDGWAIHFLDYDNDSWQDLFVVNDIYPNSLFRNPGRPPGAMPPWQDVAASVGAAQLHRQFTGLVADFDNDGWLDLCHRYPQGPAPLLPQHGMQLLQSSGGQNHWIKIRTVGSASNRDGIGARISVTTGTHRQRQWVRSGTGYMTSGDLRLHFGLGSATTVDHIEVHWPSGQRQSLTGIGVDQILTLHEPSFTLVGTPQIGSTTTLELLAPNEPQAQYAMALSFSNSPPTPIGPGLWLPIHLDQLSAYSLIPGNALLGGPLGTLDASGRAASSLQIPNLAYLSGLQLYATAATFGPAGLSDPRTVFPRAVEIDVR